MASGLFNSVAIVDVMASTPTLMQLQAYDAVITWSNFNYASGVDLGNVLADYVDAGGGVVVAVFANSIATTNRFLDGRWQQGYEVILDQSGTLSGSNATLGTVHAPSHPIMAGVSSFDGGVASYRPNVTSLEVGAVSIADWSDGRVLVARGANPKRVDLGFYPPSSGCVSSFWNQGTNGDELLANALAFVAGVCAAPTSYCTTSTTTNGCHPALSASGTPSVANTSGFVLSCANVEGQKSGLIFYGINGSVAVPWATGSTSWLCVKTPTQRTGSQSSGGTAGACNGSFSLDFLAFMAANPGALGQPLTAGQQYNGQAWFRDPPAPKTTNLSGGLQWVMCP
jgi:hypothetical protein